jgi:hypothetical protein
MGYLRTHKYISGTLLTLAISPGLAVSKAIVVMYSRYLYCLAVHPARYNSFLIFLVLLSGLRGVVLAIMNMFIQILEAPSPLNLFSSEVHNARYNYFLTSWFYYYYSLNCIIKTDQYNLWVEACIFFLCVHSIGETS